MAMKVLLCGEGPHDVGLRVWDARAQALELEKAFAEAEAELEHAAVLLPIASEQRNAAQ